MLMSALNSLMEKIFVVIVACSLSFIFVCVTLSFIFAQQSRRDFAEMLRDVQDLQTRIQILEERRI